METIKTRLLGGIDPKTPEEEESIEKRLQAASMGVLPPVVLETMKEYAWRVLGQDLSERENEKAKLVVAYAQWLRELEFGKPEKEFEQFMGERLEALDLKYPPKYKIQAE